MLVPLEHAAGHSVLGYFRPEELVLHNANVAEHSNPDPPPPRPTPHAPRPNDHP